MLVLGEEDPRALLTSAQGDQATGAWCAAVGVRPRPGREYRAGYWVPTPEGVPASPSRQAGVCAVVERGPDAGLSVLLPRGDSLLGRAPTDDASEARVTLRAQGVARRHASIKVTPEGVILTPLEGTVWLDARAARGPATVDERTLVHLGGDDVRLLPARPTPAARPLGDPAELAPGPPAPRTPWLALLAAIAPLGVGGALWWATGSWFMMLFGCLGLLTAGPLAASELSKRRRLRRAERARALCSAEEATAGYPSPGTFLAAWGAAQPAPPAIQAQPLPPGHSRFPARLGPALDPAVRVPASDPAQRAARYPVPALPVLLLPLPGERIGVRGAGQHTDALLRIIAAWWIAGLAPGDTLELARDPAWPAGLLGIPGVRLVDLPGAVVARLNWNDPQPGTSQRQHIELARLRPGETAAWIADPERGRLEHAHRRTGFAPEGCGFEGLDDAARRLARAAAAAAPPGPARSSAQGGPSAAPSMRGTDTLGLGEQGTDAPGLGAVVGDGESGPLSLDLIEHGPHALVAGTTGAGKSDFLRGWFATLAENHPPERLRFVLFDFKGGSTFGPFARLPHTECVVTDLDAEASERVLEALAVEVKRREAWLASHGAPDLASASRLPGAPAHLIVAIDEFRVLAEEVPHVLQRLVRIATVGRSLGLHLVLSTQRPQGVISPDIRANVSLVVALRLASDHESSDVLGSTLASTIDPSLPGSAYVRLGGGSPRLVRFTAADGAGAGADDELLGPRLSDTLCLPSDPAASGSFEDRLAAAGRGRTRPARPLVPAPLPLAPIRLRVADPGRGLLLGLRQHAGGPPSALRWDPDARTGLALIAGMPSELGPVGAAMIAEALADRELARRSIILDGLGAHRGLGHGHAPLAVATAADPAWADEVLAAAEASASEPHPLLLWVLGLGAWLGDGAGAAGMRREARLLALCQRPGVVPILAGTRELAGSRWLLPCPTRIYLPRGAGEESTALWPRLTPTAAVPGRGALLGPGLPERGAPVQLVVADMAAGAPREDRAALWQPPPAAVPAGSLTAPAVARASVSGEPTAWRPRGRAALVLGGPGSGRSSCARLLCEAWGEPWAQWAPGTAAPEPHLWALVDDADAWPRDPAYELAERVRSGGRVIATALASTRLHLTLPWFGDLDPLLDLVLLGPRSAAEAESCGWRVPVDSSAPPGRCWLVPEGRTEPIRAQLEAHR
ncbi:FtsK/SpoIIIE domain-containing protein [Galactobacter valiniphilus]|uniref:FtsK/SpoIIIE domain-containing protein n=1 Tax=Galactobacter valiniphilus TaxID=2676122 RepID=UPI003736347B